MASVIPRRRHRARPPVSRDDACFRATNEMASVSGVEFDELARLGITELDSTHQALPLNNAAVIAALPKPRESDVRYHKATAHVVTGGFVPRLAGIAR